MQTKDNLLEALASPENLLTAWRAVRGNIPQYRRQRSAGPDGVSLTEFERDLPAHLSTLRHMLLKGRYQPQRPGLFTIEKRSGGTRQIAVLNVGDRVAQRAANQVLEPLYEPRFLPCSFGFRPGRSIADAVYVASRLRGTGYGWVVDGDIAACFDSLDHQLLLKQAGKSIQDSRVLDLLEKWLGIGILEHGLPVESPNRLAQGWQKATGGLRQGMDWALNTFTQPEQPYDPYRSARFEGVPYPPETSQTPAPGAASSQDDDVEEDFYAPPAFEDRNRRSLQQRAVRQVAAGGLLLGSSWARRALEKAGPAAISVLKSPTGQVVIKRGLLAGGGVVGAATGVAMTAYLLYRRVAPTQVGVLQGSPLSPLLANIYLHSFDVNLTRAGFRLVRYADDWIILAPTQQQAELAYNQAVVSLKRLHLSINPQKTALRQPGESFEWLGAVIP